MNPEEVLDNVICARAHNSEQQMELLSEAAALMSDSRYFNSLISLFLYLSITSFLCYFIFIIIVVLQYFGYFNQLFTS
jgi:Rad51